MSIIRASNVACSYTERGTWVVKHRYASEFNSNIMRELTLNRQMLEAVLRWRWRRSPKQSGTSGIAIRQAAESWIAALCGDRAESGPPPRREPRLLIRLVTVCSRGRCVADAGVPTGDAGYHDPCAVVTTTPHQSSCRRVQSLVQSWSAPTALRALDSSRQNMWVIEWASEWIRKLMMCGFNS